MPVKNTLNVNFSNGVRMHVYIDERGCIFGGKIGSPNMPYMNLTPQATINLLANESGYSAGDPKVGNPNITAGSLLYHYDEGLKSKTLGAKTSNMVYNLLDMQKDPPCNKPVPGVGAPTGGGSSGYNILTWKPKKEEPKEEPKKPAVTLSVRRVTDDHFKSSPSGLTFSYKISNPNSLPSVQAVNSPLRR